MSITETLLLLCKQIHLCTDVNVTPDAFYSIKCNNASVEIMESFWSILSILSHDAAKNVNPLITFEDYGKIIATKMYFGYLGYLDPEFYSISKDTCDDSRLLLIALAWLIAHRDVLNTIIKTKITNSILGHEFINMNITDNNPVKMDARQEESTLNHCELSDQINEIIKKCMTINYNLKDIAELIGEKIRLMTKIHNATTNIANLPHLNVSELVLIKNYSMNNQKYSAADLQTMDELQNTTVIINSYVKWAKQAHVFFDWMTKIVEECKSVDKIHINNDELSRLISIIRHKVKTKIYSLKNNENLEAESTLSKPITSRFLKTNEKDSDAEKWNTAISNELAKEQTNLVKEIDKINIIMHNIMKSIPNCIQI